MLLQSWASDNYSCTSLVHCVRMEKASDLNALDDVWQWVTVTGTR